MTVVQELSFSKLNENLSTERGKYDGSREAAEKSSLKKRRGVQLSSDFPRFAGYFTFLFNHLTKVFQKVSISFHIL